MHCPKCLGSNITKNGHTHYGRQNHKCKDCGRQFVFPNNHYIDAQTRAKIKKALLERLSLRGICRIFDVSLSWLLEFMVQTFEGVPEDLGTTLHLAPESQLQCAGIQLDEMWSFVGKKSNKCWVWVVYELKTKQVIAFHIGDRSSKSAKALFEKLPPQIQEHCMLWFTDHWEAYSSIIPEEKHWTSKGLTQDIERLFCTLRHRLSRFVRCNLAFSKSWRNHELALRYFFYHHNATKALHY
jgi:IS1 family transposase